MLETITDAILGSKVVISVLIIFIVHTIIILIISAINNRKQCQLVCTFQEELIKSEERVQGILQNMTQNRIDMIKSMNKMAQTLEQDIPAETQESPPENNGLDVEPKNDTVA
jgi:hypothetical protein